MPEATTLRAGHTHLYPGARLAAPAPVRWRRGMRVVVEFADLGATGATIERIDDDGRAVLAVAAHRTARGTEVAAKRWVVERSEGTGGAGAAPVWRVAGRAGPAR